MAAPEQRATQAGEAFEFERLDLAKLRARRGEKWRQYGPDVLPAWVAEMDFPLAPAVRRSVEEALALDDLGYPLERPDALREAFAERMQARFGWRVDSARVEVLAEVVQGIYVAIDRFSEPGDGVVVQTPVYPPFLGAVRRLGRRLVENPLVAGDARWEVDLDGLRRAAHEGARVLLLCNPHNPTGRVFERGELEAIAQLAAQHDWVVVADEIHADLVYPGRTHVPFASLAPEAAERTITLTSASKAFNVPGLRCAVAHFGSEALQRRFLSLPHGIRGGVGALGQAATVAAWREGQDWLDAALAHLDGNRRFVARFVAERWPEVRHCAPESTFLAWLDFRALALAPSPYAFFLERARVALSDGARFGTPGQGFARLNFGTSRALLGEMLARLDAALREPGRGGR
ncbi:MAG: aminotransferase [Proteobacteria bacterium]|nr:MAG: aminotransferase [Pseudomonadota bacterium]